MPPVPKPTKTPTQRARASKRKGRKAETEIAGIVGGERVPLSGSLGGKLSGDVVSDDGRIYEVKVRATGFKQLYTWLRLVPGHGVQVFKRTLGVERGREKPPDVLVVRADNSPWLAVLSLRDWCAVLTELENLRAEVGKE